METVVTNDVAAVCGSFSPNPYALIASFLLVATGAWVFIFRFPRDSSPAWSCAKVFLLRL
ncbi:uncharacterized protein G2W53_032507 [Senna tora]|uniref:Uncharacterized protein n=1 Tax=Senna tora TaxID=362788 RepID=A0A834SZ72_9FABA|nr:uncharacterized protein G2W53_032507 [Senna tora]